MKDDANTYITCPYEETHRIEKYRMARHLTKCEDSHPDMKLEECPYNTLHRIKPLEFEHHLSTCEDRVNSVSILYQTESSRPVESITVEEVNSINLPLTENWDTEPEPVESYNPFKHIQEKDILFTPMLLSKSKKKVTKLKERERHNGLTTNEPLKKKQVSELQDELETPLRLPKNPPQALIKNKMENNKNTTINKNQKKTNKENVLKDSKKQNLKEEWKSKYMDEDLITFTKNKNSIETNNNSSINKDDTVEVTLNNTNEAGKNAATDFLKDLQRNNDKRCSAGRGISRIYEMYKKSGASKEDFKSYFMNPKNDIALIMKKNAEEHDYTGTFFGYTEEESHLDVGDIEDELRIIDGFGID